MVKLKLNWGHETEENRNFKRYIYALLIFVMCMVLLISCANDYYFNTDEGDVYSKGIAIAHEQVLYRDFASQHMPLMYYFAALFNSFGAATVYDFRIWFYVLFSLLWSLCAIWYDGKIPVTSFFLCPALYISMISRVSLGTSILSEHAQAIGINLLFYELICYAKDTRISVSQLVRISLGIFLAFGAAFTSIFPIFFLALTVIALDIERYLIKKKEIIHFKDLGHRYCLIIFSAVIPFVVLCIYCIFTNSLDDFYYWAYKFNVDIYSKYQPTGNDVIQSMFCGLDYILDPIKSVTAEETSRIFAIFTVTGLFSILLTGIFLRSFTVPIGLIFMLNACETRGSVFGFHSMHAIMLQCAAIGFVLGTIVSIIRLKRFRVLVSFGLLFIALVPFREHIFNYAKVLIPQDPTNNHWTNAVDILTEEGERIGNSTIDEAIYIGSKTVPASVVTGGVKWMWDGAGETAMEQLRVNPPRVYVLDEGYDVWGYPIKDYAPELIAFVHENYTSLKEYGLRTVYVLNSYYEEACSLLNKSEGFYKINTTVNVDEDNGMVSISLDSEKELHHVSAAVWSRKDDQDDIIWYSAKQERNPWVFEINLNDHKTLGGYTVHFYDVFDGNMVFISEVVFDIKKIPSNSSDSNWK